MKIEQVGVTVTGKCGQQRLTFEAAINNTLYQVECIMCNLGEEKQDYIKAVIESVVRNFETFKKELENKEK